MNDKEIESLANKIIIKMDVCNIIAQIIAKIIPKLIAKMIATIIAGFRINIIAKSIAGITE